MFSALIGSIKADCAAKTVWQSIQANIIAGITVGVIALPLSMTLAIAIDVGPQYGLYTAIVARILIALSGGSRVNISGPTAAFVVVLIPIVHQYGLGGLLVAGMMAGVILVLMGLARMGHLLFRPDLSVNHAAYFTRASWKNFFTRSGDFPTSACARLSGFELGLDAHRHLHIKRLFQIGIAPLFRVELWAIAGQIEQRHLVLMRLDPSLDRLAVMDTQVVEDQEHLFSGFI
jgi:hypothetical protein